MAYLLGNKFCIDSLRNEVSDLQESIMDVFSRAGPVSCLSWKYPDKLASDVDIKDLLELYEYSEEEEERQVAHIVLLELVIDRMVLLMQSMAKYLEQTLSFGRVAPSSTPTNNTSIGLVVKKYWNKMVHVHTVLQQMHSESRSKSRQISDLENTVTKLNEELKSLKGLASPPAGITLNYGDIESSPSTCSRQPASRATSSLLEISRDEYNKSTQTVETAFIPCDSCGQVQACLKEIGNNMCNICEMQGLTSSLAKYMDQVKDLKWLCAGDVTRWSHEQSKDLTTINKHLEDLMNTINPLKTNLSNVQAKCKNLQGKISDKDKEIKLERDTQFAQQKQFNTKLKDMEKRTADTVLTVKTQNERLQMSNKQLEGQLATLKSELSQQQDCLNQLEQAKEKLIKDLEVNTVDQKKMDLLQKDVASLKSKLNEVNTELDKSKKELNREKAKNKSVHKHSEALQGKQDGLLQRLDQLDQENEELRQQVDELEETKEQLEESLERAQEQCGQLEKEHKQQKTMMKKVNEEKENLEKSIEELQENISSLNSKLLEAKDHEKLLVDYPDLNGPVNPDFVGSGDIAKDMENQVKANALRIQILEEQNSTLRNSITKMLATQMGQTPNHANHQVTNKPMQLWDTSGPTSVPHTNNGWTSEGHDHATSATQSKPEWSPADSRVEDGAGKPHGEIDKRRSKTFVVGKGSSNSSSKTKTRPGSGGAPPLPAIGSSSIAAYARLKNAGLIKGSASKASRRPTSGKSATANMASGGDCDIYTCGKCDKMYNSKRDLDIHKSYCFGV